MVPVTDEGLNAPRPTRGRCWKGQELRAISAADVTEVAAATQLHVCNPIGGQCRRLDANGSIFEKRMSAVSLHFRFAVLFLLEVGVPAHEGDPCRAPGRQRQASTGLSSWLLLLSRHRNFKATL